MTSNTDLSDSCLYEFESTKKQFPALFDSNHQHGFESDFQMCSAVDFPMKFCKIHKTFIDIESFCFPQICQNDKIKEIVGKNLNLNLGTIWNAVDCKNVDNPTKFILLLSLFFTFVLIFIIIGTVFSLKSSKNLLPYSGKGARGFLKIASIFSLTENLKILFNTKSSSTTIDCLNGMKALSMLFIVLRHSFQIVTNYQKVIKNEDFQKLNIKSMHFTGILPTDTFFLVTGILCAKYFMSKKNLFSKFLQNIFQRYMRLTPSAVVVMSIDIAIKFLLMSTHPNYFFDPEIEDCKRYWWTSVLHIQNYWNFSNMCFGSFWFATVSMQLFLVTPFIVLILKYLNLFFGILFMVPILIFSQYKAYHEILSAQQVVAVVAGYRYTEAVTRSYPYLVGLFYYWISTKFSKSEKPKIISLNSSNFAYKILSILIIFSRKLAWLAAALILISPVIIIRNEKATQDELNIYFLIVRLFWPFGLCWIIHACHNGFGGIVNKILSAKFLIPFANISLGVYLWNDHVALFLTEWLMISPTMYNVNDVAYIFILTYLVSSFASALLFLLIEVPFHRLSLGKF